MLTCLIKCVLSCSVTSNSLQLHEQGPSVHRTFQARILARILPFPNPGDLPDPGMILFLFPEGFRSAYSDTDDARWIKEKPRMKTWYGIWRKAVPNTHDDTLYSCYRQATDRAQIFLSDLGKKKQDQSQTHTHTHTKLTCCSHHCWHCQVELCRPWEKGYNSAIQGE